MTTTEGYVEHVWKKRELAGMGDEMSIGNRYEL